MSRDRRPSRALSERARRPRRYRRRREAAVGIGSGSTTIGAVRKLALLLVRPRVCSGRSTRSWLNNPLLFPTFTAMLEAFFEAVASADVCRPGRWTSIKVLLMGYAAGIAVRGGADHRSRSPPASAPTCSSC